MELAIIILCIIIAGETNRWGQRQAARLLNKRTEEMVSAEIDEANTRLAIACDNNDKVTIALLNARLDSLQTEWETLQA